MAKRIVTIDVCDRCAFNSAKPATEVRDFSEGGQAYRLKLCEQHAAMYDRERSGWTRLAEEVDTELPRIRSQHFNEERRAEARRIVVLRERAARAASSNDYATRRRQEIDDAEAHAADERALRSIPGALNWRLTTHAAERMIERGFDVSEVLGAAARPSTVVRQPWRGEHIAVHGVGDCRVVVNTDTKAIITVIDRSDRLETSPPAPERTAL
jgi:hypothetical protein